MNIFLKSGASAVALVAAMSLAQAQTPEHQGGEKGGAAAQHAQGERGGVQGSMKNEGAGSRMNERANAGHSERSAETGSRQEQRTGESQKMGERSGQSGQAERKAQNEGRNNGEHATQSGNESTQQGREAQTTHRQKGERSAKAEQNNGERSGTNMRQEGERNAQGRAMGQRESNAAGSARNAEMGRAGNEPNREGRVNFHVTGPDRTRLHEAIVHDTAIHRYRRSDIHFAARVGERIPERIEFYSPPVQFVDIDPEFRRYKIVVLEDEILVVDPATREIVDIIPT